MPTIARFEEIEAWQTARELTKLIYFFTNNLPKPLQWQKKYHAKLLVLFLILKHTLNHKKFGKTPLNTKSNLPTFKPSNF